MQVFLGRRGALEFMKEVLLRQVHDLKGLVAQRTLVPRGTAAFVAEVDASSQGQLFNSLGEAQLLELHDEVDHAAVGLAAKAVEHLAPGRDREGSRLFSVEGTAGPEVLAALFELEVLPDDCDDIIGPADFLDAFA
ncbi:MAG: hypothetical protein HPKKFMNG_03166 [Planctomycetes bacterium]|nr:hypothetical protein [Planctomycetota bacterium]